MSYNFIFRIRDIRDNYVNQLKKKRTFQSCLRMPMLYSTTSNMFFKCTHACDNIRIFIFNTSKMIMITDQTKIFCRIR